jgi:hypothetical protein
MMLSFRSPLAATMDAARRTEHGNIPGNITAAGGF